MTNSSPVKTVLESLSHPGGQQVIKIMMITMMMMINVVVAVVDDDEDDDEDLQARTTGRQQRLERGREINVRPTKIEDVPFR